MDPREIKLQQRRAWPAALGSGAADPDHRPHTDASVRVRPHIEVHVARGKPTTNNSTEAAHVLRLASCTAAAESNAIRAALGPDLEDTDRGPYADAGAAQSVAAVRTAFGTHGLRTATGTHGLRTAVGTHGLRTATGTLPATRTLWLLAAIVIVWLLTATAADRSIATYVHRVLQGQR